MSATDPIRDADIGDEAREESALFAELASAAMCRSMLLHNGIDQPDKETRDFAMAAVVALEDDGAPLRNTSGRIRESFGESTTILNAIRFLARPAADDS